MRSRPTTWRRGDHRHSPSRRQPPAQGAAWGVGHGLMLLAVGSVCLFLDLALPGGCETARDGGRRDAHAARLGRAASTGEEPRARPCASAHGGGVVRAHRHQSEDARGPLIRAPRHCLPWRALGVGMMHGSPARRRSCCWSPQSGLAAAPWSHRLLQRRRHPRHGAARRRHRAPLQGRVVPRTRRRSRPRAHRARGGRRLRRDRHRRLGPLHRNRELMT